MKLGLDFKVLLCRSAPFLEEAVSVGAKGREEGWKLLGNYFLSLLMSYKLENTYSSRISLWSPSKDWEAIWLWW